MKVKSLFGYGVLAFLGTGALAVGIGWMQLVGTTNTTLHVQTQNTVSGAAPIPVTKPVVSQGREWTATIYEPSLSGGYVSKRETFVADTTEAMASKVVGQLIHDRLPGSRPVPFPTGTNATVKIWDGTLEIHFSEEMNGFPAAKSAASESADMGMFTKSLIGPTTEYEDIQFFIGNRPVRHLFGPYFDTSQPFINPPMVMTTN